MPIAKHLAVLFFVASLSSAGAAAGEAKVVYAFDSESTAPGKTPVVGHSRVTSTIDGPTFRNVSERSGAVELSEDDGRTTYFGALHTAPRTPLVREAPDVTAPIAGFVEDEQVVVGDPVPGPPRFGLPTRVYTVDHAYTIVARVAYVVRRASRHRARFTFTVADVGVSSAALRVAFSRGYGYALAMHPEAFIGLPLEIDGTIESPDSTVHVHVEAKAFER